MAQQLFSFLTLKKYVHKRIRRLYCLECLHSFSDRHYMAPVDHSVSYATLMTLMKLLLNPKMTFKSAAESTHLSESTVIRLFDKYCHIKRYSFPKAICIDEVYTKNSDFKSKYSCIFYDFYNRCNSMQEKRLSSQLFPEGS